MKPCVLVTGASGHLGSNLVRKLCLSGFRVKAGIRDHEKSDLFKGLDCEVVDADLLNKTSLNKAMKGVKLLFHTAAVYRHWAKDPEAEILMPNLEGTRNVLEAAYRQEVEKVVHVSSIVALGRQDTCMTEKSWNRHPIDAYAKSKVESEILALELSEKLNIHLVSVLPAAIVGPGGIDRLTPTMQILANILENKRPVDPCFSVHFVDVEDVVSGMIAAAQKGGNRERYILGNKSAVSTTQIFKLAKSLSPHVRTPVQLPRWGLVALGIAMEIGAWLSGNEPSLTRSQVKTYYKKQHFLDISKSKAHLEFRPKDPFTAIKEAMIWLLRLRGFSAAG